MEKQGGYEILAHLIKKKKNLLNSRTFESILYLIGKAPDKK